MEILRKLPTIRLGASRWMWRQLSRERNPLEIYREEVDSQSKAHVA